MAKCKYCHEVISRLDKDVCPFCGGLKPLEGTDTSTQDVTKVIGQLENPVEIKHKNRYFAAAFAIFLGFLGAPYFYIGKWKKGLLFALISLAFIGGIGSILFFTALHSALAFILPYCFIEVIFVYIGVTFITKHNIQDSHGEFLE